MSRPKKRSGRKKRKFLQNDPVRISPTLLRNISIRYLDDQIVVVDKPAGLTTVRHAGELAEVGKKGRRFLPPSLVDLLPQLIPPHKRKGRIRAVHRLDRDTSGLIVLALTPKAESHLGKQFREHSIQRSYLALVRGQAQTETIESYLVLDRGDGRRGSAGPGLTQGKHAVTHIQVLEYLGEFTLVECRLETGRTHQVRIHLGEYGTPLCGERIYDRPLHGRPLPDASGFTRPALHAASLTLVHPTSGRLLSWKSPLPGDMEQWVNKMKNKLARES